MIDFLISNERHHVAIMRPVVQALAAQGYPCRVVSLCEFRGVASPVEQFAGVDFRRVVNLRLRRSTTAGRQTGGALAYWKRRLAHTVAWRLQLRGPVRRLWRASPRLVVTANDAAFPYNRYCSGLRARHIPFILLQEGVRFTLPAAGDMAYGQNGAACVAAWGASGADYFRRAGVPETRLALTGTPQFDAVQPDAWAAPGAQLRGDLKLGRKVLLLLTNPIDDQGFCTTAEKMTLVRQFVERLAPSFADSEFSLAIKLHGREPVAGFRALLADLPFAGRIVVTQSGPLYALLALAQAAVVMTSTVGLEAMMFNLPLGVLELPHGGFAGDYVSSGAARGLSVNSNDLAAQVTALRQAPDDLQTAARQYLAHNLATRHDAATRIVTLIKNQMMSDE